MEQSKEGTKNCMKSGLISKMLDQVQSSLSKRIEEKRTRKLADRPKEEHTASMMEKQAMLRNPQTAADIHEKLIPNQFQEMRIGQYQKKLPIQGERRKTKPSSGTGKSEGGSSISSRSCIDQGHVTTKSGYSDEDDETISMTAHESTSSIACWFPNNRYSIKNRSASDSDNYSMVVELSDEEETQDSEIPRSEHSNAEDISDRSDVNGRSEKSLKVDCQRESQSQHIDQNSCRSTKQKRAKYSDSHRNPTKSSSSNTAKWSSASARSQRARKTKWQRHNDDSSDSSTGKYNYRDHHFDHNNDSTSSFHRNHQRESATKMSHFFSSLTAESVSGRYHHQLNPQNFSFRDTHHIPLPFYNNIPVLPAPRPSLWPVTSIYQYIPTNAHMLVAFAQPQPLQLLQQQLQQQAQQQPQQQLQQQPQQQPQQQQLQQPPQQKPQQQRQKPPPTPQMASISSHMSKSNATKKMDLQALAPSTSKQSTGAPEHPAIDLFRKSMTYPTNPSEASDEGKKL